jgi:hypothetical protein
VITLALVLLFILVMAQVFLLFRVGGIVQRRLRVLIPEGPALIREVVAGSSCSPPRFQYIQVSWANSCPSC